MIKKLLLSLVACALAATIQAQPATNPDPKTGAEMTGTVKDYTPGVAIVLETSAPSEPVQFKLAKNVKFTDTDGKTIEAAGLTTHQKVTVHFTKVGSDNVVDKVSLIGN